MILTEIKTFSAALTLIYKMRIPHKKTHNKIQIYQVQLLTTIKIRILITILAITLIIRITIL